MKKKRKIKRKGRKVIDKRDGRGKKKKKKESNESNVDQI